MIQVDTEITIPIKASQGIRSVRKEDVITFPEGLLGFSEYKEFVIFDITDCAPFKSMLSVDENGPNFVVVEPLDIFDFYSPLELYTSLDELELGHPVKIVVLSIVTLSENPRNITINLRGPIFINLTTRLARQTILTDERFATKVPLLGLN